MALPKKQISKNTIIGVLAGMGPRSTAPFINLIYDECQKQYGAKDDIDFPKILIYSLPAPFYPDRPVNHEAMESTLCEGIQYLERAGTTFIAIACNTAHVYYPNLAKSISAPLLNMVAIAVRDLPESKRKIAVIAARPTIESEIYQKEIARSGHEFVSIDWQTEIDILIESVKQPQENFKSSWSKLLHKAKLANADTILIACLDLSAIRQHIETDLTIVDASESLAKAIVQQGLQQNAPNLEWKRENYVLSTDKTYLQFERIHEFLSKAYWCENIPLSIVIKAANTSLCFGLYDSALQNQQIGYARIVTDYTTFAWLCDVYVQPEYRGKGLSKWMMECLIKHPSLGGLRRLCLATRDAHKLYAKYGFKPTQNPENWMEIKDNDLYKKKNTELHQS